MNPDLWPPWPLVDGRCCQKWEILIFDVQLCSSGYGGPHGGVRGSSEGMHCNWWVRHSLWSLSFLPSLSLFPFLFSLTDIAIGVIKRACEESGYVMLVTADHGNAERMIDEEGNPVTKHTTFRGSCSTVVVGLCILQELTKHTMTGVGGVTSSPWW